MRGSAVRASLLFSLLFLSLAYSGLTPCPTSAVLGNGIGAGVSSTNVTSTAIDLSVLALLVSLIIIGIIYIISKLLPGINLGRWLENEYKEIIKSFILVVVIFSVLAILSGIALTLTGSPTGNYSANVSQLTYQSEVYLCSVNSQLTNSMSSMLDLQIAYGALHSLKIIWPGISIPPEKYLLGLASTPVSAIVIALLPVFKSGVGFTPFSNDVLGLGSPQYSSMFNDVVNFVEIPMLTTYTSQLYLLPLFIAVGLMLLVPIGLIFRAVPLVRGIGGTLIALGIGLGIIWPSILVLFNAPLSNYFTSVFATQLSGSSNPCSGLGLVSTVCSAVVGMSFLSGTVSNPGGGAISVIGVAMSSVYSAYPALNYILFYNLFLIFQFWFLFIIDIILAYSITDNIARLLGGTIRLSFGRRLKLI